MDANGWQYKTAFLQTRKGKIYKATLNIANAADGRKILYDINKITDIEGGVVASKGSLAASTSVTNNSISNSNENVKNSNY